MAEPNATRVGAPPTEAAERGDTQKTERQQYAITVRLWTRYDPRKTVDDMRELLNRHGYGVDSIQVRRAEKPLASFDRHREDRR